jgi:hypothetical protein
MKAEYTEEHYRVDFETAKLLKETGFDLLCNSNFNKNRGSNNSVICRNSDTVTFYSAPLISVVLEWLKDLAYRKGYRGDGVAVFHNGTWIKISNKETGSERKDNLLFIQSCCNHLVNRVETTNK